MTVILPANLFAKRIVSQLKTKHYDVILISTRLKDFKLKNKIQSHQVVHYIGSPTVSVLGILTLLRFRLWNKKIVVSWIGYDIRRVTDIFFWKVLSRIFRNLIDVNITEDTKAIEKLQSIGIHTTLQPPPIYQIFPLKKLPNEKKVAVYLPDHKDIDFDFYQGPLIKKLVDDFPNIAFIITGNSGRYFKNNKNVTCIKWTENIEKIYEEVITVIRLPKEDTTGATIIETLSMGRNMIASSTNFPYCNIVTNYLELENSLMKIIKNPTLNIEGSRYVHTHYDNDKLTDRLISIYNSLI